jgi:hypothetical protein
VVRGLAIFQEWFKDLGDQYVLIGGTAASITMTEAGLPFRGTKDLDIVLHVEVLTPTFGQKFWEFVQAGGYQQKEGDPEQKPCLYRFQKPQDEDFPHMLELFSRVPDGLSLVPRGHLTPIPMDDQTSSLSAILLNDEYYRFVLAGRKSKYGMPSWVGEDRLIPLKAVAWLEMTERVRQGEVIELPAKLQADLQAFSKAVVALNRPEQLQAMGRIASAYALDPSGVDGEMAQHRV